VSLEREADVFARLLTGRPPSPYAVRKYIAAHEHLPLQAQDPFDRMLVSMASRGRLLARPADAYARFFARDSALRRKLSLMTAILESSPGGDTAYAPVAASPMAVVVRMAGIGLVFALVLAMGVFQHGLAGLVRKRR